MRVRRWRALAIVAGVLVFVTIRYVGRALPMTGTVERQLVVGGVTRTYLLHAGGAAKPGRPLILMLHGRGGTAAAMERRTNGKLDELADRDGAVVVYPQALGRPSMWSSWIDGPPKPDDLGFLSALIDTLVSEQGVDRKRVYAAGFSNGAGMVYRLACERPELVAAIAPVSCGMWPDVARECAKQTTPVSVLAMHGTQDPIVPLEEWVKNSVTIWARRDACPAQPRTTPLPDVDPLDGTRTSVDLYDPCAEGAQVAFYTIDGGGHTWPDGEPKWTTGAVSHDFDAGVVIWDFFQKHARR